MRLVTGDFLPDLTKVFGFSQEELAACSIRTYQAYQPQVSMEAPSTFAAAPTFDPALKSPSCEARPPLLISLLILQYLSFQAMRGRLRIQC